MQKWKLGAHGNTFGGNPLCCAAALATLDLVKHDYADNAAKVGEYFQGRLRELKERFQCIGDVRGKGLMIGMELIEDRTSRTPAARAHRAAFDAGLPPWPATPFVRREYRAFHSAAHDQSRPCR